MSVRSDDVTKHRFSKSVERPLDLLTNRRGCICIEGCGDVVKGTRRFQTDERVVRHKLTFHSSPGRTDLYANKAETRFSFTRPSRPDRSMQMGKKRSRRLPPIVACHPPGAWTSRPALLRSVNDRLRQAGMVIPQTVPSVTFSRTYHAPARRRK